MPSRPALAALTLASLLLAARPVAAFDYLEHLWFTDDACRRVQYWLAATVADDPSLAAPYLALALACPATWEEPYCHKGDKTARGHLNTTGPYSATLGDFAALPDHVSQQGPVQNLPRAGERGLVRLTLRWLAGRRVSGAIADVAEDACETRGLDDLVGTQRDIDRVLEVWWADEAVPSTPSALLVEPARAPLRRGPHDPAMKYSFDNPHYLDLVLRNHHHFGDAAHDAWNGYHSTATQLRTQTCADLIVVDADEAEDLADRIPGFEAVDWDEIPSGELNTRVCAMLGEAVRGRLQGWRAAAPAELSTPVGELLDRLAQPSDVGDVALLDAVVAHVLSLVFEGTAVHYLQDGLAAGHMRTIRSREALVEVRYDHDADNRDGVAAAMRTPQGTLSFVAWGDGYLLGRAPASECDPTSDAPAVVATCLLQKHRGILALGTIGSLLDWAYGGRVYRGVDCATDQDRAACMALPMEAPTVASARATGAGPSVLLPGSLPVPPPRFSYESLAGGFGFATLAEHRPFLWARFGAYGELSKPAHWLTSWQIRADADLRDRVLTDVGFGFHYRFWARVMLDLVPEVFVGVTGLESEAELFAGVAPRFGITVLPEGWFKIPVEFSVSADYPLVLLQTGSPALDELNAFGPRLWAGFGLAFMH